MALERWRPFGTTLERWDPLRDWGEIQTEVNRLFDSVFGRSPVARGGDRIWVPAVDVYETKDDLVVAFDLPGVQDKDVSVSIADGVLTVKGERRCDREQKDETWHCLERRWGKFERSMTLPIPVQADKVKATYREGVLEIRLPKAEEIKPKAIKIDVA